MSQISPQLQATLDAAREGSQIESSQIQMVGTGGQQQHAWASYPNASVALKGLNESPLDSSVGPRGALLVALEDPGSDSDLARLRNQLWPEFHAVAIFDGKPEGIRRRTFGSRELLKGKPGSCQVLVLRRLQEVMSPETTTAKFDQNAKGWDGVPGSPGYPHFRWMRRFVALYGRPEKASRILDFGSGAGWVGIEAAKQFPGSSLFLFDPSPEMVRIAEGNAKVEGVDLCEGRIGFGDAPPFPRSGESRYDWVISSGVISFASDSEAWLDGLCKTVAPGGTLVIGDIQLESKGVQKRRRTHPLLPVRELNAKSAAWVRQGLEARGFEFVRGSAYQLTYPIPQIMHINETKLDGLLSRPLLWINQIGATLSRLTGGACKSVFDSWVMQLRAPAE
ncbi:MAG: class I SAM-dependent methyltransferase [bacterium]|nr:class I SAM-dependent methyltransferase [bacterium]